MRRLKARFRFSLGNPTAGADVGLQILAASPCCSMQADRLDRIGRAYGIVPVFVGFDQGHQNLHLVCLRRSFRRLEYRLQAGKGSAQILVISDRPNIH